MSNKVTAPDRSVDALGAGDAGVTQLKSYFTMLAPLIVWFYVIPLLTRQIFETQMEWIEKPGSRPVPPLIDEDAAFDPLADEIAATIEEEVYVPEMIEVEMPISWTEYFLKMVLMGTLMFVGMLLSIWIG